MHNRDAKKLPCIKWKGSLTLVHMNISKDKQFIKIRFTEAQWQEVERKGRDRKQITTILSFLLLVFFFLLLCKEDQWGCIWEHCFEEESKVHSHSTANKSVERKVTDRAKDLAKDRDWMLKRARRGWPSTADYTSSQDHSGRQSMSILKWERVRASLPISNTGLMSKYNDYVNQGY